MAEVGGIPEDAYDDMITDDNERRKLQGYNINKEMKINTTRMSRSLWQLCRQLLNILTKHDCDIGCLQEIGWQSPVSVWGSQDPTLLRDMHQGETLLPGDQKPIMSNVMQTNWWRDDHACQATRDRRSGHRPEPRSVAWYLHLGEAVYMIKWNITQVVIWGCLAPGHEQWPRGGQTDQQRDQAEGHGARAQGLVQVEGEEFEFSASWKWKFECIKFCPTVLTLPNWVPDSI